MTWSAIGLILALAAIPLAYMEGKRAEIRRLTRVLRGEASPSHHFGGIYDGE